MFIVLCTYLIDSSHYNIEHYMYIHYYIIIVRLRACHVPIKSYLTWLLQRNRLVDFRRWSYSRKLIIL